MNLHDRLQGAVKPIAVHHIRGPQAKQSGGVKVPSILWEELGERHVDTMSGPSDSILNFYQISIRTEPDPEHQKVRRMVLDDQGNPTGEITEPAPGSAQALHEAVMLSINDILVERVSDYDAPDDGGQDQGRYFERVVTVGLASDGC